MEEHRQRGQSRSQPTVSVVIPAYNAAETIERALDSVYAQTCDTIIEVIVVDDGSEDATAEIVREKYPDVTLIQQENAGVSVARNVGVEAASGELIAFLDSDDEWLPEKTEVHVAVMEGHPGLALCMCASLPPGAERAPVSPSGPSLHHITLRGAAIAQEGMRCGCSVWLGRRDVLSRHHFEPALRRNEDVELITRLAALGYGVAFFATPLSVYYACQERLRREGISDESARRSLFLARRYFGADAPSNWLTEEEKRALWFRQHRISADILYLAGDDGEAHEVARSAISEQGGSRSDRARLWLMANVSSTYASLRRAAFRVLGR